MCQVLYEVVAIISTKCPCNLLASLKRRITYNRCEPSRLFQTNRKHLRKLQRPVERTSSLQQLINLFTHLFEIGLTFGFAKFGELLLSCFLVGSYYYTLVLHSRTLFYGFL